MVLQALERAQSRSVAADRIQTMIRQESRNCLVADLGPSQGGRGKAAAAQRKRGLSRVDPEGLLGRTSAIESPYFRFRRDMVLRCIKISSICKFSMETVEIAISLVDRFASVGNSSNHRQTQSECEKRESYRLWTMTALYIAVKIQENTVIDPDLTARFCQQNATKEQVEATERRMLHALQWRLHTPTMTSYLATMLEMLASEAALSNEQLERIEESSQAYILEALQTSQFVSLPRAHVAYAALLNGLGNVCDPVASSAARRCIAMGMGLVTRMQASKEPSFESALVSQIRQVLYRTTRSLRKDQGSPQLTSQAIAPAVRAKEKINCVVGWVVTP
jgi:Cyclin, N-terminal domain